MKRFYNISPIVLFALLTTGFRIRSEKNVSGRQCGFALLVGFLGDTGLRHHRSGS